MGLGSDEEREFELHPGREAPRRALEGFEVDPATDIITLSGYNFSEEYREFSKGKLIDALAYNSMNLDATVVVVHRDGKEVFREEGIKYLFGVVFF